MCAECHSTGVRKNYDAAKDRFATSFSEISVGCEACHGQGSRHVDWAHDRGGSWPFGKSEDPKMGLLVRFDERRGITWTINTKTGNAERNFSPASLRKEVETCGLCHARRGTFSEDWVPGRTLSDTHVVATLQRGLYHADGQMLDEVYNYGPFKQSKMFAAGVTCSDCHEPHGAKLRAPDGGVCLQCHSADKYASAAHHHHEAANPAPTCVSCHMPARTYMVVDVRHDHSFRIPRPDLSAKLGTPNACNDCHADKSPEWAASAIEGWHGPNRKGFQNYAEAFRAAWDAQRGRADAACRRGDQSGRTGDRARHRIDRACALRVAFEPRGGAGRLVGSRPDGAARRPRHGGRGAPQAALAGGIAAALRSRRRRPHQGGGAARGGSGRKSAARGPRTFRSRRSGTRRRTPPQCRPPRSPLGAR